MALKFFTTTLSEKVSYFSSWRFNFQKTRVIGSLRYSDEALERFVKSPFLVRFYNHNFFYLESSLPGLNHRWYLHHEEFLFLNHIIKNWSFDKSKLSQYELQDYDQAVAKLQKWNEVRVFMLQVEDFVREIRRTIYIRRASKYPNHFFARYFPEVECSIVGKYHLLLEQLQEYPEWDAKVRKEVEPIIKQLADVSPVAQNKLAVNIFFGIDLQRYFK